MEYGLLTSMFNGMEYGLLTYSQQIKGRIIPILKTKTKTHLFLLYFVKVVPRQNRKKKKKKESKRYSPIKQERETGIK